MLVRCICVASMVYEDRTQSVEAQCCSGCEEGVAIVVLVHPEPYIALNELFDDVDLVCFTVKPKKEGIGTYKVENFNLCLSRADFRLI